MPKKAKAVVVVTSRDNNNNGMSHKSKASACGKIANLGLCTQDVSSKTLLLQNLISLLASASGVNYSK